MAAATATVTINDVETGQRYFRLYVTVVIAQTYETGGLLIGKLAAKSYISPKKPLRGFFSDTKGHQMVYIPATNKLKLFGADAASYPTELANTSNFSDGAAAQAEWVTNNTITGILYVPKA
jgi:hypothetical protein